MTSMLEIVEEAAPQIGIPTPSSVAGINDIQIQRLLSLLNLEGRILARRHPWEALIRVAEFQTVAAEEQGDIETIASGFQSIINETIWDRTTQDRIAGPLSPQDWQLQKATVATGPYYNYRIREGKLLFYPVPTAGEDVFFEFRTVNWAENADGDGKPKFTADDDEPRLDATLLEMGLRWRFLESNGLDYAEAYRTYEQQVNNAIAKDGGRRRLSLNEADRHELYPYARAPDGSWSVP